jgi:hypothetical protein
MERGATCNSSTSSCTYHSQSFDNNDTLFCICTMRVGELITPQIISASNQMQHARKYYKEYENLSCDLMDMWRRSASTEIGLQTHPNCWNYMGESAHRSNSEFSSSSVRNLRAGHIKTHVQVAYDIQSRRYWTCWKDKEIVFPTELVSYPTKI